MPQTVINNIFAGIIALKLEKVGPAFSSFNTRPSLPFVARQQDKLINNYSLA